MSLRAFDLAAEPLGRHVTQRADDVAVPVRSSMPSILARPKSATQSVPASSSSRLDGLIVAVQNALPVGGKRGPPRLDAQAGLHRAQYCTRSPTGDLGEPPRKGARSIGAARGKQAEELG